MLISFPNDNLCVVSAKPHRTSLFTGPFFADRRRYNRRNNEDVVWLPLVLLLKGRLNYTTIYPQGRAIGSRGKRTAKERNQC
jgi:hypothetical protein